MHGEHFQDLLDSNDEAGVVEDVIVVPPEPKEVPAALDNAENDFARITEGLLRVLTIMSIDWFSFEAMENKDILGSFLGSKLEIAWP